VTTVDGLSVDERVQGFLAERFSSACDLRLVALGGDASTRRYFRLVHAGESSVLALYPEPFESAALPFLRVQALMASFGLPVPSVRDHDLRRGVVLLEDLGDRCLQQVLAEASDHDRRELYRQALQQLARLQREAARGPAASRPPCYELAFDEEKLTAELDFFQRHFLEAERRRALSSGDRAALAEAFARLSREIASWPRVLCHRDYHSRNLMVQDGRLRWLDFQDARMGPATYDAASLLRDPYVELGAEFAADLAEEFRSAAVPGEDRETFERRFDLVTAQRLLKAIGTFGYMATARGNGDYLAYVPRALANVRRLLGRRRELLDLRRALAPHVEELS
jgi:hypothetical protein